MDGGPKRKKIIVGQYRKINSDRDYKCEHTVELEIKHFLLLICTYLVIFL